MTVAAAKRLIYLGRSRLHRSRANLIQTFHTVHALGRVGVDVELQLPRWPRGVSPDTLCGKLGIGPVDVRGFRLMHPRHRYRWHIRRQRQRLAAADALYTRVPEIALALTRAGLRCALEVHDTQKLRDRRQMDAVCALHRDGRITWLTPISGSAADALVATGADASRVHVAPSGVDVEAFRVAAATPPQTTAPLRVIYLGRINRERGQEILFGLHQRGLIRLTLIGEQDDALPALPGLAVHGFIPQREVPGWYAKSDAVLLPYTGGLDIAASISPIKLFEALPSGRPIVASGLPSIREVIEDGRNGLIVAEDTVNAWAAAVRRLVDEPGLGVRLATSAAADADRFSWTERARGIAGVLDLT